MDPDDDQVVIGIEAEKAEASQGSEACGIPTLNDVVLAGGGDPDQASVLARRGGEVQATVQWCSPLTGCSSNTTGGRPPLIDGNEELARNQARGDAVDRAGG